MSSWYKYRATVQPPREPHCNRLTAWTKGASTYFNLSALFLQRTCKRAFIQCSDLTRADRADLRAAHADTLGLAHWLGIRFCLRAWLSPWSSTVY